jgi:hypothetical protein
MLRQLLKEYDNQVSGLRQKTRACSTEEEEWEVNHPEKAARIKKSKQDLVAKYLRNAPKRDDKYRIDVKTGKRIDNEDEEWGPEDAEYGEENWSEEEPEWDEDYSAIGSFRDYRDMQDAECDAECDEDEEDFQHCAHCGFAGYGSKGRNLPEPAGECPECGADDFGGIDVEDEDEEYGDDEPIQDGDEVVITAPGYNRYDDNGEPQRFIASQVDTENNRCWIGNPKDNTGWYFDIDALQRVEDEDHDDYEDYDDDETYEDEELHLDDDSVESDSTEQLSSDEVAAVKGFVAFMQQWTGKEKPAEDDVEDDMDSETSFTGKFTGFSRLDNEQDGEGEYDDFDNEPEDENEFSFSTQQQTTDNESTESGFGDEDYEEEEGDDQSEEESYDSIDSSEEQSDPALDDDSDDVSMDVDGEDLGDEEADDAEPEDPNRQGSIRYVEDAHLVYKRQGADGSYEELWIYTSDDDVRRDFRIKKAIIAGTDIPEGEVATEDGNTSYTETRIGNLVYIEITGLAN